VSGGRCASVAGGAGRRNVAGHAAKAAVAAGTNLRCWRLVSERRVRPDHVDRQLDDDLVLAERVEDFAVEQLVPKARVEALDVAILPRTASLDVSGVGAQTHIEADR
jgi:hypothetical protein